MLPRILRITHSVFIDVDNHKLISNEFSESVRFVDSERHVFENVFSIIFSCNFVGFKNCNKDIRYIQSLAALMIFYGVPFKHVFML